MRNGARIIAMSKEWRARKLEGSAQGANMSIGETWELFDEGRNGWRLAKIINELGNQIELQFQDFPRSVISTTRERMQDQKLYRIPDASDGKNWRPLTR
jgi:hypothetical protein